MVVKGEYNFGTYNSGIYNQGFDVDTFEFDFNFFYPIEIGFVTRVIDLEDGTEKRLRLMASGIHTFDAQELAVGALRKADLEDFIYAKNGTADTFSLSDTVMDTGYTVRFLDSDSVFEHRPDARWNLFMTFVEVRT